MDSLTSFKLLGTLIMSFLLKELQVLTTNGREGLSWLIVGERERPRGGLLKLDGLDLGLLELVVI